MHTNPHTKTLPQTLKKVEESVNPITARSHGSTVNVSKVYFFSDLLKIRYVLPLQQHFLMLDLLGF